jgi:arsenate reductase
MTVTIYHNPACGTSRTVLAAIRATGEEPEIVLYLQTPPTRPELRDLLGRMGLKANQALRRKETLAKDLGLLGPEAGEDQILDAMAAHPILIERPIVITERGVRLCRPAAELRQVLPDAVV